MRLRIRLTPRLAPKQILAAKVGVKVEPPAFSLSALPLTIELAGILKNIISPLLRDIPETWSFDDRVLAWLYPDVRVKIEVYYQKNGAGMVELFSESDLRKLDKHLLRRLAERAEEAQPGTIRTLRSL